MHVSPSKRPKAHNDLSFGSRAGKIREKGKDGAERVVGEREVTFAPGKKKKKAVVELQKPDRRKDERRSASGNVMRGM